MIKEAKGRLRLGVNIDHVATVRNARGGTTPDPLRAAKMAEEAGADGITAHLREDRRHIGDADIEALMQGLKVPLNFEMAATDEMQRIALRHKPHAVCIVPEKREERTTEGGLEVAREENRLAHFIAPLRESGCRVSIFIAADRRQIEAAHRIGAEVIELHTGAYCDSHAEGDFAARDVELGRLRDMAAYADDLGLEVHAGHGLTYDTVAPVAAFPEVMELNIGHYLVGEAIFRGLTGSILEMRRLMDAARAGMIAPTKAESDAMDDAIRRAHAIARRDDGRAGIVAVIMRGDTVLAFGENEVHRENDPTRHAEIVAISRATHALGTPDLTGATLLTTLQPCEMCLAAMRFSGISRLIYGATKPNVAAKYFMFPALDLADFQAAAPDGFDACGGIGETRVMDLYADGME